MINRIRTALRLVLTACLAITVCACFAACQNDDRPAGGTETDPPTSQDTPTEPGVTEPDSEPSEETEAPVSTREETDTDPVTEAPTETERETYPAYAGAENAKTINVAAGLANGVTGYYSSSERSEFVIRNQNVCLKYSLSPSERPAAVAVLENLTGQPYLTDTMDTFLTTTDGLTYYASTSTGRVNVYDQGFYYYDVHVLDQTFVGTQGIRDACSVDVGAVTGLNDMRAPVKTADGGYAFVVQSSRDPYICYNNLNIPADGYDAVLITLKSEHSTGAQLYFKAGGSGSFNAQQYLSFSVIDDGAYHTYAVNIARGNNYTGMLTGLRLDIGSTVGETVEIRDIRLVKYDNDLVTNMALDRDFIAYSDKINDVARFMAKRDVSGIAAMGTETKISADTVQKVVVCDRNGIHTSLDGVDWDSAEYVGFDIRDAGIFGYILLPHETSGHLSVTLEDGVYILRQSYTLEGGSMSKDSEVFVGHRIYTDPSHDFDAFLFEANCERNPLEQVEVIGEHDNSTYYAGYNALRGVYEFMVRHAGDFSYLYEHPEELNAVSFRITGDGADRKIYILAHTPDGCLENAAVLNRMDQMLPIRVEVCKNFGHDGEELEYTYGDSIPYGYAFFPMVVEADRTEELTVVHLYESWGQFRLKQISSIRFHEAYYHLSTGVTETNCMTFYNTFINNRLPDHRAMSQTYWRDVFYGKLDADGNLIGSGTMRGDQPQHDNNGSHTFLQYTSDGVTYSTNSVWHCIDSAGPTYSDITMHFVSGDGKMEADLRHVEMPQYDENRAYYQLDYRVTDTIVIDDFTKDFEIYAMTTNQSYDYQKLGYLDENNQPQVVSSSGSVRSRIYTLGSEYPYFDYFLLQDPDPTVFDSHDMYSNLSVLIKGYDIVIGGQPYTGPLVIVETNHRLVLTLDLDSVTLQSGDYIHIDMILMPWGDGIHSQDDENVRLTRENTLVHPIVTTSEKDIVLDDPWVPKVRTADGQTAIFTLSGGLDNVDRTGTASEGQTSYTTYYDRDYNITVRVYGFRDFGTAGIYELINGEWVPYEVSSDWGFDGYAVLYDEDNSFSYSFVVNMSEAKPRTFKVVVE